MTVEQNNHDCAIWLSSNRGKMYMTKQCERPEVKIDACFCSHCIPYQQSNGRVDAANVCRRALESRKKSPVK